MAYVTGVFLILLTISCVTYYPMHLQSTGVLVAIFGTAHGWLYIVYLVCAFDMCTKAKMPYSRLLWILLAGTVPTAAFFVERRVTRQLQPLVKTADESELVGV
jgi:integral membrane protein